MSGISMSELHAEVIALLDDVEDGYLLDDLSLSLPTLRVHVRRAVLAGAGRRALRQVLDVAATTALHPGVR